MKLCDAIRLALVDSRTELAGRLGISTQALWNLEHGSHSKPPVRLLRRLASVLRSQGMLDGRPAPTLQELLKAWMREHS